MKNKRFVAAVVAVSALLAAGRAAAGEGEAPGRTWAVLIGVEKYEKANPLRFTGNDVREASKTLRERGGVPAERILEVTDEAPDESRRPTRDALKATIPTFLEQPGPDDALIVFFSGHGFRNKQGRLFLAPIDCDPDDPAATGIPADWFRDRVAACKAKLKLLVLDTCHAGTEKGDDDGGVAAKDLGEVFRGLEGVVTLASSSSDEKSQIWEDRRQSLFSYWLVKGLQGHADVDGDGAVDLDELYKYVHRRVTRTAKARFSKPQTPVRIVRPGTPGVPVILRLQPATLRGTLADMAEMLAVDVEERGLKKVGVLEFTALSGVDEFLGADFGLLGRWCAEELERLLIDDGEGFGVVDRKRLQEALSARHFTVADLASAEKLKELSDAADGLPALAQGTLRGRAGRVVTLQCKLLKTDDDELAGSVGGTAALNESEWAMLGRSAVVRPDDRRPESTPPGVTAPPAADRVVERLDAQSEGPNPLQDPSFPFPIRFKIDGRDRPPVFRGNDALLPVKAGEVYRVEVENKSGRAVCMRLLVDGLNTLPEPEEAKGVQTFVWGARVNLDRARHWVLDPAAAGTNVFSIPGFVTATGAEGEYKEFVVTDAERSLAARRRFTEQIGVVTAAFYEQAATSRGPLGTDAGRDGRADLTERAGVAVGPLLGVVHVRLIDPDEINKFP